MAEPKSGLGAGRKRRTQRSGPQENQPDLETTIEDEMESSGRDSVVPRLAVVGPRPEAVSHLDSESLEEVALPPPEGANPAPTARAAERERVRHQLQREIGVLPAGQEGRLRQERVESGVTREAVDKAASRADAIINRTRSRSEVEMNPWLARANRWRQENPRGFMAAAAAVLLVGAGSAYAGLRKH